MKISPIPVVSDADVIIHLSKLEKLSFLQSLYTEVAVPEYVKSEILNKNNVEIQNAIDSFLKVRKAAKEEGFVVAGTIGVILKAVKRGIIKKPEAIVLIKKMNSQDFRIHPDILQRAIISLKD